MGNEMPVRSTDTVGPFHNQWKEIGQDTDVALAGSSDWRVLVASKGHGEAKVLVPFLHLSSPHLQRGSPMMQLQSTRGSRAQSYVFSFPLGQSLLIRKKYGSAMLGKVCGGWVIHRQWWFCSSFHAFCLYVPPSLLGWELQVPAVHFWRTQSEGQTNLLFAFSFFFLWRLKSFLSSRVTLPSYFFPTLL